MCFINIIIIIIIIRYSVFIVLYCVVSARKILWTLSKDEDDGSENDCKKIKI